MFASVRDPEFKKRAWEYKVIDKDTGESIPRVIWANDTTGRYRQHLVGEDGVLMPDREKKCIKSKIFKGNIEIRRTV